MDSKVGSLPSPESRDQLEDLLSKVLELPGNQQQPALEALCKEHPSLAGLMREVFAEVRCIGLAGDTEARTSERASGGEVEIEGIEILKLLGSGGMGEVYLANQLEPVRRKVAVKLIQKGMRSDRILARFEFERQALARMSHPCVAQVFGTGSTKDGAPYFLMEYVPGTPINKYCDSNKLTIEARLDLFVKVCEGVQHAHQKGIMHRDLKPSNILVVEIEGTSMVKIIDFGIAKATGEKLSSETFVTEAGAVIGTPEYMSPEQAGEDPGDLDTRTDVYSLGVVLYELLIGALPFDAMELRRLALPQIVRMLREALPPKPSTKLQTLLEVSTEPASRRRATPTSLARKIRGDLDWITMKAMEKDRDRRYVSAAELAADIERYQNSEPVQAGPPSTSYMLRKFIQRNRLQVAAGMAIFLVLVVGIIISWSFYLQAKEEKARAEEKEADARNHLARFDRLSVVVHLDIAELEAEKLYPAWPKNIADYESWLHELGDPLEKELQRVRQTLKDIEASALPQSREDKQVDREQHPLYEKYLKQKVKVNSLQTAMDTRQGKRTAPKSELPADLPEDPLDLHGMAWKLLRPQREAKEYGQEPLALALSERALATSKTDRHFYLDNLAWAQFANGLDDEAKTTAAEALQEAPEERKKACETRLQMLTTAISNVRQTLADARETVHSLEAAVRTRRTYSHANPADTFLHKTLGKTEKRLVAFVGKKGHLEVVRENLAWARSIQALTIHHPKARVSWTEARESIRKADGVVASGLYGEQRHPMHPIDLKPQIGLVPIGMNPETKLWEFYHLRSAWDPALKSDPDQISIPSHEKDGTIQVREETGIVFVLLPGGTFTMGAQGTDSEAANYVDKARDVEKPVRQITVSPFFLARHELTQGQWGRLSGETNPSYYAAGAGVRGLAGGVDLRHPVELVSWNESRALMEKHGLLLPTEAQWEYGCRAGTTTAWFSGPRVNDLEGFTNLGDLTAKRIAPHWALFHVPFEDGHVIHAPVGTYRPNPFGLHEVHGNVSEFCRDKWGSYYMPMAPGDGERQVSDAPAKLITFRGGSFNGSADEGRSAYRHDFRPTAEGAIFGLRASRSILQR